MVGVGVGAGLVVVVVDVPRCPCPFMVLRVRTTMDQVSGSPGTGPACPNAKGLKLSWLSALTASSSASPPPIHHRRHRRHPGAVAGNISILTAVSSGKLILNAIEQNVPKPNAVCVDTVNKLVRGIEAGGIDRAPGVPCVRAMTGGEGPGGAAVQRTHRGTQPWGRGPMPR
jgi:hypothetical protein